MRAGDSGIVPHLSEMYPCNEDTMTAEHLLQHYQLHDALRGDTPPEPIALRDKFYDNLEELGKAAAFVRATGISVRRAAAFVRATGISVWRAAAFVRATGISVWRAAAFVRATGISV